MSTVGREQFLPRRLDFVLMVRSPPLTAVAIREQKGKPRRTGGERQGQSLTQQQGHAPASCRAPLASARSHRAMSKPRLSLSDDQLTSLMNAAAPLPSPHDRNDFLSAIADRFAGREESIGDGELHRAIVELQRIYFKAPTRVETYRTAPQLEKKVRVRRRAVAAD
jgi:hypothetical protein